MSKGIADALKGLVGEDAVLNSEASQAWLGGSSHRHPVVVSPMDETQVAAVMSRATEEGWQVEPAGGGGWRNGSSASDVQVVITTRRMTAMEEYEPPDLTFTAGAGLTMAGLDEATEPHGQWLPLDPPGGRDATLGTVVSTAVPGPLRELYGTPRDHVLGLTVVAGDGRILRWGGRVVKNVAGFDVTRLVTGSWGTLGVITSVSARLFPKPEADRTLVFSGRSSEQLLAGGQDLARSRLPLAAIELQVGTDPTLALRLMGTRAQVEDMDRRIRADLEGDLGTPQVLSSGESLRFHRAHQDWESGADLVLRLSLLPSCLSDLVGVAEEVFGELATDQEAGKVRATAHVGSGVLRVGVWGLPEEEKQVSSWVSAVEGAREDVEERGGSLRLSSAPTALLAHVDPWGTPDAGAAIAAALKAEFDPAGILAPGRLGL